MSQPKRFGPFLLDRMIGRGGMGAVYRATHETTGQIVAVKALLLPLEQERVRFDAEISTLKLLRHENIVKLYGYGQEDGILYYAMEYVDGPSLSTLLKRGRRFTWEEVVYIGESICRALKHAHDRGVVHRDIKPANILLVNNGIVKVSDYGIAQYFGASRLTNAHQVVGTIEFMAPEQAKAGAVTPKTDMYSLGALMYALLVGKPPYVARSLPELLEQFRKGFPEPVRNARPEIPKVVDDLLHELLQIDPDKRPGDARIIGRRLQALLISSPNCPDGNPFLNRNFSSLNPTPKTPSIPISSSRVDLENPTDTTMAKESLNSPEKNGEADSDNYEPEDERAPDFPYRSISEDLNGELDFESPFDKTTERATGVEQEEDDKAKRPEELRDDFVINESGEETDPEGAKYGESETSTGEYEEKGSESASQSGKLDAFESSETVTLSPSACDYSASDDLESSETLTGASSESTLGFDYAFDDGVKSDSEASAREESETRTRDSVGALAQSGASNSDKKAKASATTVVEKVAPISEPAKSSRPRAPEPQPAQIPIGKNVPFDELGEEAVEATPLEKFKKSQFTEVGEDELGDLPQRDEEERPIVARFRVVALGLAFAAVICAISFALRAPSADSLYNRIDKKLRASSEKELSSTLRRVEKDMKRFTELYPNDERVAKINYFLCELQIDELDQRLERQLQNSNRTTDEQPIPLARAYLYARKTSLEDWELGAIKLRAFIDLYGSSLNEIVDEEKNVEEKKEEGEESEASSDAQRLATTKRLPLVPNRWKTWNGEERASWTLIDQLVEIAKRRLASLEKDLEIVRAADLALLQDRLISAERLEETNPQQAEKIRNAAKALYGDRVWAQEKLQEMTRENDARSSQSNEIKSDEEDTKNNEVAADGDADVVESLDVKSSVPADEENGEAKDN